MPDVIYTVTEMAKTVGVVHEKSGHPSAVKLNLLMQDLGIQTKVNDKWTPSKGYQKYAVLVGVEGNNYYKWKEETLLIVVKGMGRIVSQKY